MICSMCIPHTRKQKIFEILLFLNILSKMLLDKGSLSYTIVGDDQRQGHQDSDQQIPQVA